MKFCLIYVTCKNTKEAENISKILLQEKLIACANIEPEITSIYEWEGKIETSKETRLILKTTQTNYKKVENLIKQHHSYSTACILQLAVEEGNEEFLSWIEDSVIKE